MSLPGRLCTRHHNAPAPSCNTRVCTADAGACLLALRSAAHTHCARLVYIYTRSARCYVNLRVLCSHAPPFQSPPPSPKVRPRHLSVTLSLSRTSPFILSPSLPKMAKKRRSLQSILVPSFLPQASTSALAIETPPPRARSHTVTSSSDLSGVECSDWLSFYSGASSPIVPATPSRNSPPPDLLDDDPFANRSPAPSLRGSRATSPVRTVFDIFADGPQASLPPPRSPLAPPNGLPEDGSRVLRHASSYSSFQGLANAPSAPPPTPTEPSTPLLRRPKSSGPPQVRPAYTRPAFAPRPSLPSLNTLARTSIHVPKVIQAPRSCSIARTT